MSTRKSPRLASKKGDSSSGVPVVPIASPKKRARKGSAQQAAKDQDEHLASSPKAGDSSPTKAVNVPVSASIEDVQLPASEPELPPAPVSNAPPRPKSLIANLPVVESRGAPKLVTPCTTLYVNRLVERISRQALRDNLFEFFSQFGLVVKVVLGGQGLRGRGQAWVVFSDISEAKAACVSGVSFLGRPLSVEYAKTESTASAIFRGEYNPRPPKVPQPKTALPMSLSLRTK